MGANYVDLVGKGFGHWNVLKRGPNDAQGKARFFCECICGNQVLVHSTNLTRGLSKGCQKCSKKRQENYHGMSKSKTYSCYIQMIERCHNESHKYYSYYGARGIFVCDSWQQKFTNFLEDMGEAPEGLSIDRIDNEKGYSKDNCRWTTKKEQQRNRRNSIHEGEVHNDWIVTKRLEKPKNYLIQCLHCGVEKQILSCNFRTRKNCQCK